MVRKNLFGSRKKKKKNSPVKKVEKNDDEKEMMDVENDLNLEKSKSLERGQNLAKQTKNAKEDKEENVAVRDILLLYVHAKMQNQHYRIPGESQELCTCGNSR